jgi:hypothetical protein
MYLLFRTSILEKVGYLKELGEIRKTLQMAAGELIRGADTIAGGSR